MKRFITALLAVALLVPVGLPVDAQFPFPVAHFSEAEAGGGGATGGALGSLYTPADGDRLGHNTATGWVDGETGTFSAWLKRTADGSAIEAIYGHGALVTDRFLISITASDLVRVFGGDGTTRLDVTSSTAISDTSWHHVLISFDLNNVSNRGMYIDDAAESPTWTTYDGAGTIDYNPPNPRFVVSSNAVLGSLFNGTLSELWFDPSFIDITVEANRRDFITSGGLPADLGSNGENPTGSSPKVYLPGGGHDGVNSGTTANYSVAGSPASVDGPNP